MINIPAEELIGVKYFFIKKIWLTSKWGKKPTDKDRFCQLREYYKGKVTMTGSIAEIECGNGQLEGIPITKKWLKAFGFQDKTLTSVFSIQLYWNTYLEIFWMGKNEWHAHIEQSSDHDQRIVSLKPIGFIHELQDLYFNLSGRNDEKMLKLKNVKDLDTILT